MSYGCPECPSVFSVRKCLYRHLSTMHGYAKTDLDEVKRLARQNAEPGPGETRHPCLYCSAQYTQRRSLMRHHRTEHPTMPAPPRKFNLEQLDYSAHSPDDDFEGELPEQQDSQAVRRLLTLASQATAALPQHANVTSYGNGFNVEAKYMEKCAECKSLFSSLDALCSHLRLFHGWNTEQVNSLKTLESKTQAASQAAQRGLTTVGSGIGMPDHHMMYTGTGEIQDGVSPRPPSVSYPSSSMAIPVVNGPAHPARVVSPVGVEATCLECGCVFTDLDAFGEHLQVVHGWNADQINYAKLNSIKKPFFPVQTQDSQGKVCVEVKGEPNDQLCTNGEELEEEGRHSSGALSANFPASSTIFPENSGLVFDDRDPVVGRGKPGRARFTRKAYEQLETQFKKQENTLLERIEMLQAEKEAWKSQALALSKQLDSEKVEHIKTKAALVKELNLSHLPPGSRPMFASTRKPIPLLINQELESSLTTSLAPFPVNAVTPASAQPWDSLHVSDIFGDRTQKDLGQLMSEAPKVVVTVNCGHPELEDDKSLIEKLPPSVDQASSSHCENITESTTTNQILYHLANKFAQDSIAKFDKNRLEMEIERTKNSMKKRRKVDCNEVDGNSDNVRKPIQYDKERLELEKPEIPIPRIKPPRKSKYNNPDLGVEVKEEPLDPVEAAFKERLEKLEATQMRLDKNAQERYWKQRMTPEKRRAIYEREVERRKVRLARMTPEEREAYKRKRSIAANRSKKPITEETRRKHNELNRKFHANMSAEKKAEYKIRRKTWWQTWYSKLTEEQKVERLAKLREKAKNNKRSSSRSVSKEPGDDKPRRGRPPKRSTSQPEQDEEDYNNITLEEFYECFGSEGRSSQSQSRSRDGSIAQQGGEDDTMEV